MLSLLDEHVSGQTDHNYRLWLLLNLEMWYRMFVENQSRGQLTEFLLSNTEAVVASA
jgi:hypothetical protein